MIAEAKSQELYGQRVVLLSWWEHKDGGAATLELVVNAGPETGERVLVRGGERYPSGEDFAHPILGCREDTRAAAIWGALRMQIYWGLHDEVRLTDEEHEDMLKRAREEYFK